jgi:TetR/AcrR family transcriptional regulator, tetracycline repressor protein
MNIQDARGNERSVSKRGRPRLLTEEQVARAAMRLARVSNLEDISMRSLAQALGVPVMTLYSYVANKEALNELVSNHVLQAVSIPNRESGSWEERLRQLERAARRAVAQYPGVKINQRGGVPSEAARLTSGVLSILEDGGFAPGQARLAFAALFTFMIGQIEIDHNRATTILAATLESVTQPIEVSRDEAFEFALSVLIEGFKGLLGQEDPAPS